MSGVQIPPSLPLPCVFSIIFLFIKIENHYKPLFSRLWKSHNIMKGFACFYILSGKICKKTQKLIKKHSKFSPMFCYKAAFGLFELFWTLFYRVLNEKLLFRIGYLKEFYEKSSNNPLKKSFLGLIKLFCFSQSWEIILYGLKVIYM